MGFYTRLEPDLVLKTKIISIISQKWVLYQSQIKKLSLNDKVTDFFIDNRLINIF